MKGGCGFPMGPFALLDLVGLDTSVAILDALYEEFRDPNYATVPLLRRMVTSGQLGRKTKRGFYDYTPLSRGRRRGPAGQRPQWPARRRAREVRSMSETSTPRDAPWVMRTYSGHSTARASNELYRSNLAKGRRASPSPSTCPTQTGYDPDSPEAAGEVGKVGVPVAHLGHMEELMDQIPVDKMNTSMTINATAAWLLGLYVAHAEDRGVEPGLLSGTTQNDIVKEYLSRGTYIFPPAPSLRLTIDTIAYTVRHVPKWNPINVCSYHLQEAGATPTQEVAYALATAIGVLDGVRAVGQDRPVRVPRRGRTDQLLREFERPFRRGDLQNAGVHRHVGPHLPRALRRGGSQTAPFPLRGAGQLPRVDRTATREQRAPHRARVARRHAVQERPGPGHAAAGLERGARSAPPVGSAVVAADTADLGLRVRSPRIRRHLRGLQRD